MGAKADQIWLREKRYNYLPQQFVWRGVTHRVHRVERAWSAPATRQQSPRHYFRVRCLDDRVYQIFQDVRLNAWFVERSQL
ncbi:MAG TPA: DUF6504 family protein [Herpetosiphonaceae bacterium]